MEVIWGERWRTWSLNVCHVCFVNSVLHNWRWPLCVRWRFPFCVGIVSSGNVELLITKNFAGSVIKSIHNPLLDSTHSSGDVECWGSRKPPAETFEVLRWSQTVNGFKAFNRNTKQFRKFNNRDSVTGCYPAFHKRGEGNRLNKTSSMRGWL